MLENNQGLPMHGWVAFSSAGLGTPLPTMPDTKIDLPPEVLDKLVNKTGEWRKFASEQAWDWTEKK